MYQRLGMEWRVMRNVYKNHLPEVKDNSEDARLINQIASKCDEIDQQISKAIQAFGKPKLDADNIREATAEIFDSDNRVQNRPPLSNRLTRLVEITDSIMVYDYEGIFDDSQGDFADWYRGL